MHDAAVVFHAPSSRPLAGRGRRGATAWGHPQRVGAAGFLLKRADADELVQAVRLVARSDSVLFPSAVRALAAEHARGRRRPAPWVARLTGRESEVLRSMAAGLTNAEIAARMGVGPATVKTHVAAVLAKTGAQDRTQAVIAAYESGFMKEP